MHTFQSFRAKTVPLTVAAAGLWALSTRVERRTAAEAAAKPQVPPRVVAESKRDGKGHSPPGESETPCPFPPPIGPMVAVFLDQTSVDKLKAHYPEAREGQLRRVIVQFGTSASERQMYRHLFGGKAEVTVTGDASSHGRRALAASVTHAGHVVSPLSLSTAIDVTPALNIEVPGMAETDGPGPLASIALIEQVKKAGATEKDMWQGKLPPLSTRYRQFPSEQGGYIKFDKPVTVNGTICRADWVDGASVRCRDTLEGGGKRQEDWAPSNCSICAEFESSPCGDIFNRYVLAGERGSTRQQDGKMADKSGSAKLAGNPGGSSTDTRAANQSGENAGREENEGGAEGGAKKAEEMLLANQQLEVERFALYKELRKCAAYHDIVH